MSFTKTAALVALSSTLAFAGTAMAQHTSKDDSMKYGLSLSLSDTYAAAFGLGFDVKNSYIEAGVGASVTHTDATTDVTSYDLNGYLGFRKSLSHVWGSFGLMASYGMRHNSSETNVTPYNVGLYLGAAYEPAPSVEIFIRAMPISYYHNASDTKQFGFFSEGQVGVGYFFNV